jgi:hypothetical protein
LAFSQKRRDWYALLLLLLLLLLLQADQPSGSRQRG